MTLRLEIPILPPNNFVESTVPPVADDGQISRKGKWDILVVDDGSFVQTSMQKIIDSPTYSSCKYTIEIAPDGDIGVEKVKEKLKSNGKYDLIFMDCQMKRMHGDEATGEIRKLDRDVFIVIQSSENQVFLKKAFETFNVYKILPGKLITSRQIEDIIDGIKTKVEANDGIKTKVEANPSSQNLQHSVSAGQRRNICQATCFVVTAIAAIIFSFAY
jgi:CheY-like chemotaxis protein